MPKRVQRSRRQKQPENTKYAGRPTMWGNPIKVGLPYPTNLDSGTWMNLEDFERFVINKEPIPDNKTAARLFKEWLEVDSESFLEYLGTKWRNDRNQNELWSLKDWLWPLRGLNLSCWCKKDDFCHVDTLLELANK